MMKEFGMMAMFGRGLKMMASWGRHKREAAERSHQMAGAQWRKFWWGVLVEIMVTVEHRRNWRGKESGEEEDNLGIVGNGKGPLSMVEDLGQKGHDP